MGSGQEGEEEAREVVQGLVRGTEPERREALVALLWEHRAAFQLHPGEKGWATWVEHRINTGDHPPIKQPPRRLAPHRRALIDAEVEKMLGGGIIEPAEGPWASPVVLVKKKDG